jgi:uncharacterized protein
MKKISLLILLTFVLVTTVIFTRNQTHQKTTEIKIGNNVVHATVANTPLKQAKGLMFVENMPRNEGMLFVFERESPHIFWMKNTLISLDIIWINSEKRIIDIQTANPCVKDPCQQYAPKEDSLYVLEVNANWAKTHGVKTGDYVEMDSFAE